VHDELLDDELVVDELDELGVLLDMVEVEVDEMQMIQQHTNDEMVEQVEHQEVLVELQGLLLIEIEETLTEMLVETVVLQLDEQMVQMVVLLRVEVELLILTTMVEVDEPVDDLMVNQVEY